MIKTTYQKPEIRDANDNIIQQGAFGKNTALANATNDGWIDYVANDLEFLYDLAKDEVVPVPSLPASGQMNKTYLLTTTGVSYRWSGTEWVAVSSSEAVGRAETAATNAQNYANAAQQSADDAQDVADDMADHLAQIDQNTGGISANSKRIGNIEKLLQGNLYDYQTDSTSAYTKTVPAGALPYAGIEQIGGKTLVWNQLVDPTYHGIVSGTGVTFTNNGDGTYTVNGTATSNAYLVVSYINTIPTGHKLFVKGCPSGGSGTAGYTLWDGQNHFDNGDGVIFERVDSATRIFIRVANGTTVSNLVFTPQLTDLTLLYGAGNEPATVQEFEAMFPASYYPYNAGTLLSAGVTSVVSKDSNDDALQTLSIPAEVQALTGYGWSAGSVYNYIDFERKVFVQNVARVDLGTQNWRYNSTYSLFYTIITGGIVPSSSYGDGNGVCPAYATVINAGEDLPNKNMRVRTNFSSSTSYGVLIKDESYEGNATNFKNALSGVYLYYPLATPIETDISAYLTDNLIEVGVGGTLTFPNQNGADYHIPIPSTETYMIDLQEAIENGN